MKTQMYFAPNKQLWIISVIFMLSMACSGGTQNVAANSNQDPQDNPQSLVFEKAIHDFGQIKSGDRVTFSFLFTNKGTKPVVISRVDSGCGCTVGGYPQDPILPGKSGEITVGYNSTGRIGHQSQSVRVFTNLGIEPVVLTIRANVLANN